MSYSINEILKAAMGRDEKNEPKSSILFSTRKINEVTEEDKDYGTVILSSPTIDIKKLNEFIMVDLIFAVPLDAGLRRLWASINLYADMVSKNDIFSDEASTGMLVITPIALKGEAFISASNPIFYTLQPQKPGEDCTVIRLLFTSDSFQFVESDDIDIDELRRSAEREMEKEAENIVEMEAEEEERRLAQEKRDAKIEELKKKL